MISENEYNQLQKAKRNAEYLGMLEHSMEEAKNGKVKRYLSWGII